MTIEFPPVTYRVIDGGAALQCLLCGAAITEDGHVETKHCPRCDTYLAEAADMAIMYVRMSVRKGRPDMAHMEREQLVSRILEMISPLHTPSNKTREWANRVLPSGNGGTPAPGVCGAGITGEP
jgi:hypothetical protein